MATTTYARRKAARLCVTCRRPGVIPPHAWCPQCLAEQRVAAWQALSPEDQLLRLRAFAAKAQRPAAPIPHTGALIAHCRAWLRIAALPFLCPLCGHLLFQEAAWSPISLTP